MLRLCGSWGSDTLMQWCAEIHVALKPSVNDPPGLSIRGALRSLGFAVDDVRSGKRFEVSFTADDRSTAEAAVERMCAQLLANPVIETYSFTLREEPARVA